MTPEVGSDNSLEPKLTLDQTLSSAIAYSSLIENFGNIFVDGILLHLGIDKNDLSLDENVKKILDIMNGDI